MNPRNTKALLISCAAAAAFLGAFMTPFVSSDFDPTLPKGMTSVVDAGISEAGGMLNKVGEWFGAEAKNTLGTMARGWVDSGLESMLGEVGFDSNGQPITWDRCFLEGTAHKGPGWRNCVKAWIAHKAGIPVGIQTLLGAIGGLFSVGEVFLGVLLVLFSICFPLLKVFLCAFLSLGMGSTEVRERAYWLLKHTSKWSMTDVFVVALLITFFKAEAFNFHFKAEIGVYLFAFGAILSSVVVAMLEKHVASSPAPVHP